MIPGNGGRNVTNPFYPPGVRMLRHYENELFAHNARTYHNHCMTAFGNCPNLQMHSINYHHVKRQYPSSATTRSGQKSTNRSFESESKQKESVSMHYDYVVGAKPKPFCNCGNMRGHHICKCHCHNHRKSLEKYYYIGVPGSRRICSFQQPCNRCTHHNEHDDESYGEEECTSDDTYQRYTSPRCSALRVAPWKITQTVSVQEPCVSNKGTQNPEPNTNMKKSCNNVIEEEDNQKPYMNDNSISMPKQEAMPVSQCPKITFSAYVQTTPKQVKSIEIQCEIKAEFPDCASPVDAILVPALSRHNPIQSTSCPSVVQSDCPCEEVAPGRSKFSMKFTMKNVDKDKTSKRSSKSSSKIIIGSRRNAMKPVALTEGTLKSNSRKIVKMANDMQAASTRKVHSKSKTNTKIVDGNTSKYSKFAYDRKQVEITNGSKVNRTSSMYNKQVGNHTRTKDKKAFDETEQQTCSCEEIKKPQDPSTAKGTSSRCNLQPLSTKSSINSLSVQQKTRTSSSYKLKTVHVARSGDLIIRSKRAESKHKKHECAEIPNLKEAKRSTKSHQSKANRSWSRSRKDGAHEKIKLHACASNKSVTCQRDASRSNSRRTRPINAARKSSSQFSYKVHVTARPAVPPRRSKSVIHVGNPRTEKVVKMQAFSKFKSNQSYSQQIPFNATGPSPGSYQWWPNWTQTAPHSFHSYPYPYNYVHMQQPYSNSYCPCPPVQTCPMPASQMPCTYGTPVSPYNMYSNATGQCAHYNIAQQSAASAQAAYHQPPATPTAPEVIRMRCGSNFMANAEGAQRVPMQPGYTSTPNCPLRQTQAGPTVASNNTYSCVYGQPKQPSTGNGLPSHGYNANFAPSPDHLAQSGASSRNMAPPCPHYKSQSRAMQERQSYHQKMCCMKKREKYSAKRLKTRDRYRVERSDPMTCNQAADDQEIEIPGTQNKGVVRPSDNVPSRSNYMSELFIRSTPMTCCSTRDLQQSSSPQCVCAIKSDHTCCSKLQLQSESHGTTPKPDPSHIKQKPKKDGHSESTKKEDNGIQQVNIVHHNDDSKGRLRHSEYCVKERIKFETSSHSQNGHLKKNCCANMHPKGGICEATAYRCCGRSQAGCSKTSHRSHSVAQAKSDKPPPETSPPRPQPVLICGNENLSMWRQIFGRNCGASDICECEVRLWDVIRRPEVLSLGVFFVLMLFQTLSDLVAGAFV